jgi:Holliday junction resolvase
MDMATTPEGKVKAKVVKLLKERGVYYFFPATFGMGRSGVPDIVCCQGGGHFLAIECKAGKNKPTALQEREIEAIRAAGGTALVINETNLHELEAHLDEPRR